MKFHANRGGHAPGHLRAALIYCLDADSFPWFEGLADDAAICFSRPTQQQAWESWALPDRARWLVGQLWNCTDILGSQNQDKVELREGAVYTYGQLVRRLATGGIAVPAYAPQLPKYPRQLPL